ncbi:MAG: UDP-N-acetylmuramate--L-alanine ligase, partial [Smithellaceae bacterium]
MSKDQETGFMQRKVKHIHFVGIGGIGMSGIAEVLLNLGYGISGSDVQSSDTTKRLQQLGAAVAVGHTAENIGGADVVVTSTAVKADNPEVLEAHRKNIPVIPRAEMLAELLKMKFSVAVSGSHGKTTTTSMISTLLAEGGLDPTMVIGGKLASIGSNARLGGGDILVAEADESDGSFLKLSPTIAVITNIDREHLDYYPGIEEIKDAFLKFANMVPFYGCTVMCGDNEHVRAISPSIKRRVITYGITHPADYTAGDIRPSGSKTRYALSYKGESLGDVELAVPGLFNVYNSMAAIAVGRELGLEPAILRKGLVAFSGVQRRLEIKGEAGGITVVDDYGHHPTEIMATLAAARQTHKGRLIVVFQPHRLTRT